MKAAKLFFCALLCASFARAEPSEARPPERVIRDFYEWYVRALTSDRDPFTTGRAELKRFATERLIREIDRVRKGPDGLDGDYFVDAQDFDKDWATNIVVSTPAITGKRATAEVKLNGKELGTRQLRVTLSRESSGWKIDKVEGQG